LNDVFKWLPLTRDVSRRKTPPVASAAAREFWRLAEKESRMAEVFVSTDVEADGPIPGPHSMLSFASAAYRADKTLLGTFEANLALLPGAAGAPETMEWWKGQPEAWAACRLNPRDPAAVMPEYAAWLKALPGDPVFVAYPAAYDFMFVYWYLIRFAGESPFSYTALDIKSYAMAVLGTGFRETVKPNMPSQWFDDLPCTHVALDDAKSQGALFCNILAARATQHAEKSYASSD
jgi:hypothetical protein